MYEDLQNLRPDLDPMFGRLSPFPKEDVTKEAEKFPLCPKSYWAFVTELGVGWLEQDGEPFYFEEKLQSAEREYYGDAQIYSNGAKGDVMIFGHESMGTAYGFDTGAEWNLVEVDEFRIVTPLDLDFQEFVRGLIVCYPQIPMKYCDHKWIDGVGKEYCIS